MSLPFHIGQSFDDVREVAKRTNRRPLALEFTDGGETYRFDLDAFSARERREKREAMEAEVGDRRVDLGKIPVVKYVYDDCALTFEKGRGPKGVGALVYRVTEIRRQLEDVEKQEDEEPEEPVFYTYVDGGDPQRQED